MCPFKILPSVGCDYHPTVREQTVWAGYEAEAISNVLNWPSSGLPLPPPVSQNIQAQLNSGTGTYWVGVAITNDAGLTASVSFKDSGSYASDWVPMTYQTWGAWTFGGNPLEPPFSLQLTSSTGVTVTAIDVFSSFTDYALKDLGTNYFGATPAPTHAPTPAPTRPPTPAPTRPPTPAPTRPPTPAPTRPPTPAPTRPPTPAPTRPPTPAPTRPPTPAPTRPPTPAPTRPPTPAPTRPPTPAPTRPPTPAPTHAPTSAPSGLVIYDDKMENGWAAYEWVVGTLSIVNTSPAYGTYSMAFEEDNWNGFNLVSSSTFAVGSYTYLQFSVNGGALSNQPIVIYIITTGGGQIPGSAILNIPTAIEAGTWVLEKIPLSSFDLSSTTQVGGFALQYYTSSSGVAGTIYIDNISLI